MSGPRMIRRVRIEGGPAPYSFHVYDADSGAEIAVSAIEILPIVYTPETTRVRAKLTVAVEKVGVEAFTVCEREHVAPDPATPAPPVCDRCRHVIARDMVLVGPGDGGGPVADRKPYHATCAAELLQRRLAYATRDERTPPKAETLARLVRQAYERDDAGAMHLFGSNTAAALARDVELGIS